MIGAIIGDIVGSRFEFGAAPKEGFDLFTEDCSYTDDTICTIAIADAILNGRDYQDSLLDWCKRYPDPMGGYGTWFDKWLHAEHPQPMNSYGNGSAMRVSSSQSSRRNKGCAMCCRGYLLVAPNAFLQGRC